MMGFDYPQNYFIILPDGVAPREFNQSNLNPGSQKSTPAVVLSPSPVLESYDIGLELLNDPEFTDVTFLVGSEEIKAHKNVLACRSQVFRRMFTSGMTEASASLVQVDDLDFSTFNLILRYIYTGKVTELDPDMTFEVIHGAEKYGLEKLKEYCFAKLAECITDDNVGALAVGAYLYRAQLEVVTAIRQYLDRDFLKRVRANPEFRQLVKQYPDAFYE